MDITYNDRHFCMRHLVQGFPWQERTLFRGLPICEAEFRAGISKHILNKNGFHKLMGELLPGIVGKQYRNKHLDHSDSNYYKIRF